MSGIEKREDGWYADGFGPYRSRDDARNDVKILRQERALDTYAENVAATEALDGAEDTEATELVEDANAEFSDVQGFDTEEQELADVSRETVKQVRERENIVYMALYADSSPARAYWRRVATERGFEVPAEDATV